MGECGKRAIIVCGCIRRMEGNEGSPAAHCRLRNQRTSTPFSPPSHTQRARWTFGPSVVCEILPRGILGRFFPPYFLFSSVYPVLPSLRRTLRNYRTEGKCFIYIYIYSDSSYMQLVHTVVRSRDCLVLYCVYMIVQGL